MAEDEPQNTIRSAYIRFTGFRRLRTKKFLIKYFPNFANKSAINQGRRSMQVCSGGIEKPYLGAEMKCYDGRFKS